MEDDLTYFLKKEDDFNFLKMEDDLKKIMQRKTIKIKNNDCGTDPGNLVYTYKSNLESLLIPIHSSFKFYNSLEISHELKI